MQSHEDLAAALALYGVRSAQPILDSVIPGPFVGGGAGCSIATAATTDIPLITGTNPAFYIDYRLNQYAGVKSSAGNPTGVLFVDEIGVDVDPGTNSVAQMQTLLSAWSVKWQPQGSSRVVTLPLTLCARISAGQVTTANAATYVGFPQPVHPFYAFPGGSLKVNLQADTFVISNTAGAGATLASTVTFTIRAKGAFVVQGLATSLGLLSADVACNEADIPKVLAGRKALGQHTGGGGRS